MQNMHTTMHPLRPIYVYTVNIYGQDEWSRVTLNLFVSK